MRDDARKHHPSMVPYAQLSEPEKDKDRAAVRNYLAQVKGAGYRNCLVVSERGQKTPGVNLCVS